MLTACTNNNQPWRLKPTLDLVWDPRAQFTFQGWLLLMLSTSFNKWSSPDLNGIMDVSQMCEPSSPLFPDWLMQWQPTSMTPLAELISQIMMLLITCTGPDVTSSFLALIMEDNTGAPELHPQAQWPLGQSWRRLLLFIYAGVCQCMGSTKYE